MNYPVVNCQIMVTVTSMMPINKEGDQWNGY